MKKTIISIITIFVVILISILLITYFGSNNIEANIKEAKTALMINNHIDDIKNIDVYYGDETYYVADYILNNKEYIGIMNTKYELINSIEKDKLFKIEKDYIIGYKNNKIIYEVKENNKDGIVYYYYDATNGELINKINMNR